MKTITSKLSLLKPMLLALVLVAAAYGQSAIVYTTTTAAVTRTATVIPLTSVTGITAQTAQNQINSMLYIDRELMSVISLSGLNVTVRRGQGIGSVQAAHISGARVAIGQPDYFTSTDRSGSCTSTSELVLPRINVSDGFTFDCRSTGQWLKILENGIPGNPVGVRVGASCTGTVGSAETEFLNGPACSGATAATTRYVVVANGTVANLSVYSSAAVTGGTGKDLLTMLKNGSATTLTCTIAAAGVGCTDVTHSVAVVAGDVLTFSFVTATSDTAANVAVAVQVY